MTVTYETLLKQDFELGYGAASRINPQGGTMTGDKIGIHTFSPNHYNVLDFGALGDGSTDDTTAIQSCITQCKTDGAILLFPPGKTFKVTDTLFLGRAATADPYIKVVEGWGATVTGAISNKPIFDWVGGHGPNRSMRGLTIDGDDSVTPSCGLLMTRPDVTPVISSGLGLMQNLYFTGDYQTSCVYNVQSETNLWLFCYFTNNSGESAFICTDTNSRGLTSPNATIEAESTGTIQWFYGCTFNYKRDPSVATSSCVEFESWVGAYLDHCQFNDDANDIPAIRLDADTAEPRNGASLADIKIQNCSFHSSIDRGLVITGDIGGVRNISLRDCRYAAAGFSTADVVIDAGFTLRHCDFEIQTKFDASGANTDLYNDCKIRSISDAILGAVTVLVARQCEADIWLRSTDTLTLSGSNAQKKGYVHYTDTGMVLPLGGKLIAFTADDATPDVSAGDVFYTANTGVTITAFEMAGGITPGKTFTLLIQDGNTVIDFTQASLLGNGGDSWAAPNGSTLRATANSVGNKWHCIIEDGS